MMWSGYEAIASSVLSMDRINKCRIACAVVRRRRAKRRLVAGAPRAPSAGPRRKRRAGSAGAAECRSDGCTRAPERARRGQDARRAHLSVLMKRGVIELPLPHALKKYVNLGRCFQF